MPEIYPDKLIAQANSSGEIRLEAGIFSFAKPFIFQDDNITLVGKGLKTSLHYTGKGSAFRVNSFKRVQLEDFQLHGNKNATDGIVFGYVGDKTGWMHSLKRVEILNFPVVGVRYTNCEQCITEQVNTWRCGVGFWADNSTHRGKALGMNNYWRLSRAQESLRDGWILDKQSAAQIIACQSLQNVAPNAQFWLKGGCNGCTISGLDVESKNKKTIGLLIAGLNHTAQVNAVGLRQGIHCASLKDSTFLNLRFWGNAQDYFVDDASSGVGRIRNAKLEGI